MSALADKQRWVVIESFDDVPYTAGGATIYSKVLPVVEDAGVLEVTGTVTTDVLVGRIVGVGPTNKIVVVVHGVTTGTVVSEYSGTLASLKVLLTGP